MSSRSELIRGADNNIVNVNVTPLLVTFPRLNRRKDFDKNRQEDLLHSDEELGHSIP